MAERVARIGFIGLGTMGEPMAGHLVAAGFTVFGHNRSQEAVRRHAARGGTATGSVAELSRASDVVITMLPDSPQVSEVVLGGGGVLESVRPGTVLVDMSTIDPSLSRSIADRAAQQGVAALDAPVSGGQAGALAGTLAVMVGGDVTVLDRVRDVLEPMSSTVVHVGPAGAGQVVKAANQLLVAGNIQLVAEAIRFIQSSGLDAGLAVAALSGGLAGSRVLDVKSPNMLDRSFEPGFRIELHHKDLSILGRELQARGLYLPLAAQVSELMAAASAGGLDELDHSALYLALEGTASHR